MHSQIYAENIMKKKDSLAILEEMRIVIQDVLLRICVVNDCQVLPRQILV